MFSLANKFLKKAFSAVSFPTFEKTTSFLRTKTDDIILKVKKLDDLFYKSVIPLSCGRLLHPDVEEFIIEEAEKLQKKSSVRITIQVEEQPFNTNDVTSIIHRHFENKRHKASHQKKKSLRLG